VALSVFLAGVCAGRLLGNGAIARLGAGRVFFAGALTGGCGLAGGLLIGRPAAAIAGLALLGLGLANLLPICIAAAGDDDRVPVGTAVARVSMLGYLGSFAGPALIGALASAVGLRAALLLPAAAVAVTALAARSVRT
jgi:hypothetical protein